MLTITDVSETSGVDRAKKVTVSNARNSLMDTSLIPALTSMASNDTISINDVSAALGSKPKKITYENLKDQIIVDASLGDYVTLSGLQTISGQKIFSTLTTFQNGILSSSVRNPIGGASGTVTVSNVQITNNNISANNLYAKLKPDSATETIL